MPIEIGEQMEGGVLGLYDERSCQKYHGGEQGGPYPRLPAGVALATGDDGLSA
jgi:hypothetical protein